MTIFTATLPRSSFSRCGNPAKENPRRPTLGSGRTVFALASHPRDIVADFIVPCVMAHVETRGWRTALRTSELLKSSWRLLGDYATLFCPGPRRFGEHHARCPW